MARDARRKCVALSPKADVSIRRHLLQFCGAVHTSPAPTSSKLSPHRDSTLRGVRRVTQGPEEKATDQGGLQMGNLRTASLLLGCSVLLARASFGDAPSASQQEMRSLDEQVQEIKSDVLGIAADL